MLSDQWGHQRMCELPDGASTGLKTIFILLLLRYFIGEVTVIDGLLPYASAELG